MFIAGGENLDLAAKGSVGEIPVLIFITGKTLGAAHIQVAAQVSAGMGVAFTRTGQQLAILENCRGSTDPAGGKINIQGFQIRGLVLSFTGGVAEHQLILPSG